MKKITALLLAVLMLTGLAACGRSTDRPTATPASAPEPTEAPEASTPTPEAEAAAEPADDAAAEPEIESAARILIAYFSRADENYNVGWVDEGNTAKIAQEIAAQTGGELIEIRTVDGYPADYDECTDVALQEQKDRARPALAETLESLDGYDVIYLGYPIWWGDLPMAVYTFLEGNDLSGKTIHPFSTHEGSGDAGTAAKIEAVCPDAEVTDVLSLRGSAAQNEPDTVAQAVSDWLEKY